MTRAYHSLPIPSNPQRGNSKNEGHPMWDGLRFWCSSGEIATRFARMHKFGLTKSKIWSLTYRTPDAAAWRRRSLRQIEKFCFAKLWVSGILPDKQEISSYPLWGRPLFSFFPDRSPDTKRAAFLSEADQVIAAPPRRGHGVRIPAGAPYQDGNFDRIAVLILFM